LYSRVSTTGQTVENQLLALRSFAVARGWDAVEFVDHGVSGTREKRPALETLLAAVRARRVDVVACVKLDRLARSTHHLVTLAKELEALGVDLVVLDQAIDTTTPSGRLLFHMLAAVAEFERDLIRDRVLAGLRRAKERGTRSGRSSPSGQSRPRSARPCAAWQPPRCIDGGLRSSTGVIRSPRRRGCRHVDLASCVGLRGF